MSDDKIDEAVHSVYVQGFNDGITECIKSFKIMVILKFPDHPPTVLELTRAMNMWLDAHEQFNTEKVDASLS